VPTSTPDNKDDTVALLPPPDQTEEAEIQKGTDEPPSARDRKEENEENGEREGKGSVERKERNQPLRQG
jgi:hypothetical protein